MILHIHLLGIDQILLHNVRDILTPTVRKVSNEKDCFTLQYHSVR